MAKNILQEVITAIGLTEPNAGSESLSHPLQAMKAGIPINQWTKTFITNGYLQT
jgi:alkylation response protein AidB-like acyl-CoA dehydrogenase